MCWLSVPLNPAHLGKIVKAGAVHASETAAHTLPTAFYVVDFVPLSDEAPARIS